MKIENQDLCPRSPLELLTISLKELNALAETPGLSDDLKEIVVRKVGNIKAVCRAIERYDGQKFHTLDGSLLVLGVATCSWTASVNIRSKALSVEALTHLQRANTATRLALALLRDNDVALAQGQRPMNKGPQSGVSVPDAGDKVRADIYGRFPREVKLG